MRIGPRLWKTALAVAGAIAISRLLHLEHPVFAGVAAVICMQPTVAGSVQKGLERMQATIIGAAFSLLALMLIHSVPALQVIRPAIIGLTVLVVMVVTIRLGWLDSLVLAAATVVVIMVLPPEENMYLYSASRTVLTFIGIVVATAVNALFVTPRYSEPMWRDIASLVENSDTAYEWAAEAFCFRKVDLARRGEELLADASGLLDRVSTAMQWVREEADLRRRLGRPSDREMESLNHVVELLISIRQSTATVLRLTMETLSKKPAYAEQHAQVYDILWDLAQLSFSIFDRVKVRLSEQRVPADESIPVWTDELQAQLIKGIRGAYRAPRDIFPLVEVSVVAFEIRRVTEYLADLDRAIAEVGSHRVG